ncbi:unnamed protein product [Dovyalis caffra]|uniref:Uncharacterized protein n=1 Tax=Dovyalis caffra TaxID=77055 RepID=A0AAV1QXP9_9ROSI|nr:unnamed protein product [Dovyalis caffra]
MLISKYNKFPGDMNAGSGQNLDLSLGISQPSNGPKGKDNVGDFHCRYGGCEIPNKERQVVEGTAAAHMGLPTLHGVPMASKNLPAWSGIYPGLLSSYEEKATEKRAEAVCSPRFSSWPWQINGSNNVVATMSQLSLEKKRIDKKNINSGVNESFKTLLSIPTALERIFITSDNPRSRIRRKILDEMSNKWPGE